MFDCDFTKAAAALAVVLIFIGFALGSCSMVAVHYAWSKLKPIVHEATKGAD